MRPHLVPPTRSVDHIDVYHGTAVADPFRWLEDVDAPDVVAWVADQNRATDEALAGNASIDAFRERVRALSAFERRDPPTVRGGRWFQLRHDGVRDHAVLWVGPSLDEMRALLDPNAWSDDRSVAMVAHAPSPDGRLVAYATSTGGSNWMEWRVVDAETGEALPDVLRWSKFSGAAWHGDGFFYSRYDAADRFEAADRGHKLCYHRLGTPQDDDEVVFEEPAHPERTYLAGISEDQRFLVITAVAGHDGRNALLVKDLTTNGDVVAVAADFDGRYTFVGNDERTLYVLTDRDAPTRRLVAIDMDEPSRWRTIVGERDVAFDWCTRVGDTLFAGYLDDVATRVERFALDGSALGPVPLPGRGWAAGFGACGSAGETFFAYTSYDEPPSLFRYTLDDGTVAPVHRPAMSLAPLTVEQRFVTSRDGARVPVTLVRAPGARGEPRPTFLYGYGGFGISLVPWFSPAGVAWAERGGVYAVANIRGGGEYGEGWHRDGSRAHKQNCFDDFIAVAEWLIAEGYTTPSRLAISGGSNGGLLVGACITQRPELFGAAHATVGLFDMLRFPAFTIGWAWLAEYGSPDDPDDFARLRGFSPLHNVRPDVTYPPVLLATGDHDDHVVPSHSYKFAATLQAAGARALLRVYRDAGHGIGKPQRLIVEEQAEMLGFLWEALEP